MPSSSLLTGFVKAAGTYLLPIPFSRQNILKDVGKKLVFAVAVQQAIHGGLGLLIYPSIEDTFKDLGIESSVLEKLDIPHFAFVRPAPQDRNLFDHIYAMTDMPTIGGVIHGIQRTMGYSSGVALPYPICDISLPKKEGFAKKFAASSLYIDEDHISSDLISDEDALALILAHEMGHCHLDMHIPMIAGHFWDTAVTGDFSMFMEKQFWQAELYSDHVAMHFAAQIDDPDRSRDMQHYTLSTRAGQQYYIWNADSGFAYDYAMVLASYMRGNSPPSFEKIARARRELADYTVANIFYQTRDEYIPALLRTIENFLIDDKKEKSPLSIMRAELYIDALRYLAPDYTKPQTVSSIDTAIELEPSPPTPL